MQFGITIFLSAFLLFQVQPMIGKIILPWFGSSPAVWSACMLFFQALLLGGYGYAYVVSTWLSRRAQAIVHIGLLLLAASTLPMRPEPPPVTTADNPTWQILVLLARTVGLPYLMLSTSGPLFQAWYAIRYPGLTPYRLYALSNFGSLLALLGYPFLIEPWFRLMTQTWIWSAGFVALVFATGFCAWTIFTHSATTSDRSPQEADRPTVEASSPTWRHIGLWTLLAMLGTTVLLSTTNQLCQDVAVVPFLWILPLTAYLLSFIFCFESDRWYKRLPFLIVTMVTAFIAVRLQMNHWTFSLVKQVVLYVTLCFSACMCCHGELARLRPSPRWLTLFYLMISVGGALGGVFVAILAPVIFLQFWEFDLAIAAVCLVTWVRLVTEPISTPQSMSVPKSSRKRPISRRRSNHPAPSPPESSASATMRPLPLVVGLGVLVVDIALGWHMYHEQAGVIRVERNFYGVLSVQMAGVKVQRDVSGRPTSVDLSNLGVGLYNGQILHGIQYINDPKKCNIPTTYYGKRSGVGLAITEHPLRDEPNRPFRIGVVGLGVGTIATYARPQDTVRFYDINPSVIRMAIGTNEEASLFTYCQFAEERGAIVESVQGDARLRLTQEAKAGNVGRFDVLAIDAFNGDAVPVHLMTQECLEVYLQHLAPNGILAFHISNLYLDLGPIVHRLASELKLASAHIVSPIDLSSYTSDSRWVLASRDPDLPKRAAAWPEFAPWGTASPSGPLWTDDFSSIAPILMSSETSWE